MVSRNEQAIRDVDDQWRNLLLKINSSIANAKTPAEKNAARIEGERLINEFVAIGDSAEGHKGYDGRKLNNRYDISRISGDIEAWRSSNIIAGEKDTAIGNQSLLKQAAEETVKGRNEAYGGAGYSAANAGDDPTKATGGLLGFINNKYRDDVGRADAENLRIFGGTNASGEKSLGLLGEMTRDATFTPEQIATRTSRASADVRSAFAKARGITNRNNQRMGISPTSAAWQNRDRANELNLAAGEAGAINDTTLGLESESREKLSQVRGLGLQLRPQVAADGRYGVYAANPIFNSQDPNSNAISSGLNQSMQFYNSSVGQDQFTRNLNFQQSESQKNREAQEFKTEDLIPIGVGGIVQLGRQYLAPDAPGGGAGGGGAGGGQ